MTKKTAKNTNLHKAKKEANNEFYTQITDIEKELKHYKQHFKNKVIFCNCDDPETSNFWKYFSLNFEFLGLKKLIATHYDPDKPTYKLELFEYNKPPIKTPLKQNGDFRSDECIEILKEADIVVTNPPFSHARLYIAQLIEHDKRFVIIGNKNSITYKEVFKLIKDNQIWLGYTSPSEFGLPDGTTTKQVNGLCRWFTNLPIKKRTEDLILYKTYKGNESEYPTYDNYSAIEVSKVKNIPADYWDAMGCPITFLDKHNPEQFDILGITDRQNTSGLRSKKYTEADDSRFNDLNARSVVKTKNGYKSVYARIIIKRRKKK